MPITLTGPTAVDLTSVAQAANYTAARGGYLDKLNILGPVAQQAETVEAAEGIAASYTGGNSNTFSAWQELIASSAAATVYYVASGGFINNAASGVTFRCQIGSGAGGAEIARGGIRLAVAISATTPFVWDMPLSIAASTRFATRSCITSAGTAPDVITGLYLGEVS